jgi:hypothetical protein
MMVSSGGRGTQVGDLERDGPYDVANVVGSSSDGGSKALFWTKHTGRDFYDQKCGIKGCPANAEVGGHMYIKNKRKFCWILPICQSCNKDPDLDWPNYQKTNGNVILVAREMTEDMRE